MTRIKSSSSNPRSSVARLVARLKNSTLKNLGVNSIGQCRIDFLEQAVLCERRVLVLRLKIHTGQIQMNLTNLRIQRGSMLESLQALFILANTQVSDAQIVSRKCVLRIQLNRGIVVANRILVVFCRAECIAERYVGLS